MEQHKIELLIGNEDVPSGRYLESRDPGKLDEVVGEVAQGNPELADRAVRAAHEAFLKWRHTSVEERAALLCKAADLLEKERDALAPLMTRETGMLVSSHREEIMGSAGMLRVTAEQIREFFAPSRFEDERNIVTIEKVPLGVVAAITPWNVPLAITIGKVAPAIAAGNTVVVKPSPNSAIGVSVFLKKMAALFPPGVINVVHGDAETGTALVSHPLIRKITFTGGGATASSIMRTAAGSLKRLHLELGGNDPAIVLDDARLEEAVPKMVEWAFRRSGQVCVAIKRVYIPERMFKDACDLFAEQVNRYKVGYGLDPEATFAPVNNRRQYDYVKGLIASAKKGKAQVLELGTRLLDEKRWANGYYLLPTLVIGPEPGDEVVLCEQFGPVLPLVPYRTEEEAIGWANGTEYGLGATVWTSDYERGMRVARQIESGVAGINGGVDSPLGFHKVPFGGVKQSGIGWERGLAGLMEFVNWHGITFHK